MSNDDKYVAVVLGVIRDQNKTVLAAVGQIKYNVETVASKDGLSREESRVDTIHAAVTGPN